MSKTNAPLYDLTTTPLVVGRVPSFPIETALQTLGAADPLAATREFYAQNAFARTALAVGSPSLARAVDEWIEGKAVRNPKTPLRALSYLIRMASRATPFGLFAGVDRVTPGESTTLGLDESNEHRHTYTRPDMELLCRLAESVERGEVRERVRYRTNDAAFVRGDRLYVTNIALANYAADGGMTRTEQREVSLKNTAAVAFVREYCRELQAYAGIADALSGRFEAPPEQARRLLDRLVEAGVVISELRPSPVGDPVEYLLERFDALGAPFASALRTAVDEAAALDHAPLRARTAQAYTDIQHRFAALLADETQNTLQVDMRVPLAGTLARDVLEDVAILADSFERMGRVMLLKTFRNRFFDLYEGTERMVPLIELVDNNVGLGIPDTTSFEEKPTPERDALMMDIACEAMRNNSEEIVLEGDLLDRFLPPLGEGDGVPLSLEIGFSLAARSPEALVRGEYLLAGGFVSDVALKSLGRFAHVLGEDFTASMRDVARASVPAGEFVAEFSYAPPAPRSLNVLIRPLVYGHEVRAGIGAAPAGDTLSLDDLWVGLENGRFFLWSRSRECRVSLRETHAFMTYANAPNLCRLLALLHADGKRFPGVDWGPAAELTYLPRLRRGRVVLAPRRWRFARANFGGDAAAAGRELARLRTLWNMPRYVYVCEEDNRLLLDLESPVSAALFDDQAPSEFVRIEEALPAPGEMWLRGSDGTHAIEFVAQAVSTRNAAAAAAAAPSPARVLIEERPVAGPGSQWTYARLYLGAQAADNLIAGAVLPAIAALRDCGAVDRWFFVRYADPRHHLRLRVHAASPEAAAAVRDAIVTAAEGWLKEARILRYALDTYEPEYERYGGLERMADVERFFTHDSDVCASLIGEGLEDLGARIEAAAATFDAYLSTSEDVGRLVLDAFAGNAKKKSPPRDREAIRRLAASPLVGDATLLEAALRGERPKKRIADLLHMHCNRLDLQGENEERVAAVVRGLALARFARRDRQAADTNACLEEIRT